MKKNLIVYLFSLLLIIITVAFTITEQPRYKNLKILPKNISKQQLDSVMHQFSMSLNVRCNFCHLRNEASKKWDFASDSLPDKLIARKMMIMTLNINKKYFQEEGNKLAGMPMAPAITCYTCHRGATMPLTNPPPPPPKTEVILEHLKIDTPK